MPYKRTVDFAILCPIPEEWNSACERLDAPTIPPNQTLPTKQGSIAGLQVICVNSGKGESATAACLQSVHSTWRPRWVLLVGVAGGFPDMGIHRGDVVVAKHIYNFDFGKLTSGEFVRRPDDDLKVDRSLLAYSQMVMKTEGDPWKLQITRSRPDDQERDVTKVHDGYIASSNKVVDDPDQEFFNKVKARIPEVHAVEMEGSGAGAAMDLEQSRRLVGFLMIRGVSDEPHRDPDPNYGTEQRRKWKLYAADVATAFARQLIMVVSESSGQPNQSREQAALRELEAVNPEQLCAAIRSELGPRAKNKKANDLPARAVGPSILVLHGEHFANSYLLELMHLFDEASIKWLCPSMQHQAYSYAQAISNSIEECSHILFLARSTNELTSGWAAYAKTLSIEKERKWIARIVKS